MKKLHIVIPIYPKVDIIDVTVTFDALSRIPSYWTERELDLQIVAATTDPILTGQGVKITPTSTFDAYRRTPIDVLLLPGSLDTTPATGDETLMKFVKAKGATAKFVTSVCTGAIILARAGLLDGYEATTHWFALDSLRAIDGVRVVNGYPRWVHDRNRITGGGISSSLDATLYLISRITDDQTAKCCQLILQYHPQPPFDTGDPGVADRATYLKVVYG